MKTHITALIAASLFALPSASTARDKAAPVAPKGSPGNWFPSNSYPPEAKRKNEQGRVSVQLTIAASGMPKACKVISSSGFSSLDTATCNLALANGRFTPATDARGRPIEATYTIPGIRWELYDDYNVDLSAGVMTITMANVEIDIDEQGNGVTCRPLASVRGVAGCGAFKPGTKITQPLVRDGKPVVGKVTMTSTMVIEPR